MKLRYIGSAPVTFIDIGMEVQPDEEFSVPVEESSGYLARPDIVEVAEDVPPPARRSSSKKSPEPAAEVVAEEVPQDSTETVSESVTDAVTD